MTLTKPQIEMLRSESFRPKDGKRSTFYALLTRGLLDWDEDKNKYVVNKAGRAALAEAEKKQ